MIRFENVVKKFGSKMVLNDLSFELKKAEITFVLGRSGTGKSVLLKNIVGLMKPSSGRIFVKGQEVTNLSEDEWASVRRTCGMVFQQPALFDSLSVFDNVAYGLRRHLNLNESELRNRVQEALSLVHLSGIETKLPQELSFGMQKRVSLARTLAVQPDILLFDEPTTGLDPVTTRAVNQLIADLSRQLHTTSIVVSHDMNCAIEIADRIIVLEGGKIIEQGSVEQLKKSAQPIVKQFLAEVPT